jgi:Uma2 family endonuclease
MSNVRTNRLLTYADYAAMPEDGKRYELLDGILFEMAAPSNLHQFMVTQLVTQLTNAITDTQLMALCAPCDVRLPQSDETPDGATTVVQPDVLVIPTKNRLDACQTGAPIFAIEVLSPSSQKHDRVRKLQIYEDSGVREYWIVDPEKFTLDIYRYGENGFDPVERCDFTKPQPVNALCGVVINLPQLLRRLNPNAETLALDISEAKMQEAIRTFQILSPEEQARMRNLLDS